METNNLNSGSSSDDKKIKVTPKIAIWLAFIIAGFVFFLVVEYIAYVPSGKVIDSQFLNTLKVMTVLKYLIPIAAIILLTVPVAKSWIHDKKKWIWLGMLAFIVIVACVMGTKGRFSFSGAWNGIKNTPSVETKTVTDKMYSKTGMTYTIYFDDDSFGHVNRYHYRKLESGDEVYVVYCDGEVIGVFKTDEYTLDV
ncbi:MAG: hypothetical protein J5379_04195 [Clostridiales bacterium]|nr:hypothetical protein [Clostridiales bacterium]